MSAVDDPTTRFNGGALQPLDPATYKRHFLHSPELPWPETNCYVDLWIEALHAQGLPPEAAMAFTLALDFEGDQWTFYKFPVHDLEELFGVEVQELSIWKSPERHAAEQVAQGRLVMMEVDSHYLPDLTGTSYKTEHTKTTIGIQEIDVAGRRLGYFHSSGYYHLSGEDFVGVFRMNDPWTPSNIRLLTYTEFVKFDRMKRLPGKDLAAIAVGQLRRHLAKRPRANPFVRYRDRFRADLEWLKTDTLQAFHLYAFATLRQVGSCFQCAAAFLRFLGQHGESGLEPVITDVEAISQQAKTLQFKLARVVNAKKPLDVGPPIDELAGAWESAMGRLVARYG
jgi:hypothetical protein